MPSINHVTSITLLLLLIHPRVSTHPSHGNIDSIERIELLMPGLSPQVESNFCRSLKLEKNTNIVGYEPNAKMPVVHHILIYGCEEPSYEDDLWYCGEMGHNHNSNGGHHHHNQGDHSEENLKSGGVCKEGREGMILYAWAMNAPNLMLPPGVGFKVGPETKVKYIVLQMHYGNVSSFQPPNENKDYSGVVLLTKTNSQPKQAGIYLMVTDGTIPSHSTTYLEAACQFKERFTIHPFAFRTHTHTHGKVVSGYRVRGNEWTEIGRKDPQLPQMFYNVTNPGISIQSGDVLVSRCTMINEGDEDIQIGGTSADEMCNFYFMFYVEGNQTLEQNICVTPGFPTFKLKRYFDEQAIGNMPQDVSAVPGSDEIFEESDDNFKDNLIDNYGSRWSNARSEEDGENMLRIKNALPVDLKSYSWKDNVDEDKNEYMSYEYSNNEDHNNYHDEVVDLMKQLEY